MASLFLVSVSVLLVYAQTVDSAPTAGAPAAAGPPPKGLLAPTHAASSSRAPQQSPQQQPFSAGVRYDQRQTGNLNVQVDLKDVEIYAIFDDSLFGSLGDYEYDYSQLTERPPSTTSSSSSTPSSSSTQSNGTSTTQPSESGSEGGTSTRPITIFFTRKAAPESEKPSLHLSSSDTSVPVVNTSLKIVTNEIAEKRSSPSEDNDPQLRSNEPSASALLSSSVPSSTSTSRPTVVSTSLKPSVANRRCGAGFHRDASGRCRRNRRPLRNKNSSTKNGSSKSKSSTVPRTLGKDTANGESQQEQRTPSKPASDTGETVQNKSTA